MNFKGKNGITLIALVITIIVLLILAGISIAAITGENGVIKQAGNAKDATEISEEKEIIQTATILAIGKNKRGDLTEDEFKNALDKQAGTGKTNLAVDGNIFVVEFVQSGRKYEVDADGNVNIEQDYTETAADYFIWETNETTATIIGVKSEARELEVVSIPNTYQGLPVTKIKDYVYLSRYCSTYKDEQKNTKLKKVKIPANLVSIGRGTFSHCMNLQEIKVDENNTKFKDIEGVLCSKDGKYIIQYPYNKVRDEYRIPDGIEIIADYAFSLSQVKKVILDKEIQKVGLTSSSSYCFYESEFAKSTEVLIPSYITNIDIIKNYIIDFENLQSIKVEDNNLALKDIDGVLFNKSGTILYNYPINKSGTSYKVPDTVQTIESNAMTLQKNLETLTMGTYLKEIKEFACTSIENLKTITLNDKITTIGRMGFWGCSKISSINIPNSLTSIGDECFTLGANTLNSTVMNQIKAINNKAITSSWGGAGGTPLCFHVYNY